MNPEIRDPAPPTDTASSSAMIVNAWAVADGHQDEFVEALVGLFEHLCTLEGFVEGAILQGVNPTRFISYMRLRSAQDRQRVLDDREASARLRAVGRIARADLHSYDVLRAFGRAG